MTVMPNQPTFPEQYQARLLRRLTPVLVGALVILALMAIVAVFLTTASALRLEHTTTLSRAETALQAELNMLANITRELAADAGLRSYIAGDNDNLSVALERFTNLIRSRPNTYLAFRYIDLQGRVQAEIANENNVPRITDPALLAAEAVGHYNQVALDQVIGSTRRSVAVGALHAAVNDDSLVNSQIRVEIDFYVPVYSSSGVLTGALQAEVNATEVFAIVSRADETLLDAIAGRHLLLVQTTTQSTSGLIIADSDSDSDEYLQNLNDPQGNAGDNALYQQAVALVTERPTTLTTELNGARLVSTVPLAFPNHWVLVLADDLVVAFRGVLLSVAFIGVLIGVLSGGGILLMRWLMTPVIAPLVTAETRIRQLAQTNTVSVDETPTANHAAVQAVEQIATRLTALQSSLHAQVGRRTRDLQVAGRIGREIATLTDLEILVPRTINLICNELGFYHAQVFLLEETQTLAVLRFSRGDAGKQLLARGHKIRVGSNSVIGTVTGEKRPIIIHDTLLAGEDSKHGFNPLLPETRSEMGLPLMIGDTLIGALDIQSRDANAFLLDDVPTFQLVADQLAMAIYHAQLKTQSDERVAQIDRLNRQLTREAWEATEAKNQLAPSYGETLPLDNPRLVAPITIRGETIGTLDAALSEGQEFTDGDKVILNAVAERVALAVENARLFQETQATLTETSILYDLNRRLNEASTLEDILLTMLTAIAPDAASGQVWLFDDLMPDTRPDKIELIAQVAQPPHQSVMPLGAGLQLQQHPFLQALTEQTIAIIYDVAQMLEQDDWLRELFMLMSVRAVIFIPLNMRGVWRGLITLGFPKPRQFADREKRLFTALIAQAGVAIDNRLLLRQTEDALSRNEKLYAASRIINTASAVEDLVYAAVGTSSHYDVNFWLSLLEGEPDENGWSPRARRIAKSAVDGSVDKDNLVYDLILPDHSAMRQREPDIFIDAAPQNEDVSPQIRWMREQGQQFMAIFPLFSDNTPIALFYIVSPTSQELTLEDFEVYKALTGQMSTQIQNRRLLERTETALNEARRLYVASNAVTSAQDISAIYDAITGHLLMPVLRTAGGVGKMSLSLLLARPYAGADAPYLEYVYEWYSDVGHPSDTIGKSVLQTEAPFNQLLEESETGYLVYTRLAPDDLPMGMYRILIAGNARSALVVPLSSRQQWFGVLIIRSDAPLIFDSAYVRFAGAIAGQVAIAIERQQLLAQTEQERANLNGILSTLPAGVMVLDPDTFVPQLTNDRVSELLQQPIDFEQPFAAARYNLYRTGTNLFYPDEELPTYTAKLQNRPISSDDVAVILPDFRTDLLLNAAPIYDHHGAIRAIVVAIQNISNLRSLENTLQENLRETVSLYETQRALSQAESLDELLDNILMQLVMQQPGNACIILSDVETGVPTLVRHLTQPLEPVVDYAEVLTDRVLISADINEDRTLSPETRLLLVSQDVRSILIVPLLARTRTLPLGWLMLTDPEIGAFTVDQERVLATLGDMATTAVDNNYLVRSTQIALRETASLYNATANISRARDAEELSMGLEEALIVLRPDMYAGFLMDAQGRIRELFNAGFEDLEATGVLLRETVFYDLTSDNGEFVEALSILTPGDTAALLRNSDDIGAYAIIALRVKNIASGRLVVAYREPHYFTEGEKRFLNTIVDSSSVVLDNQLLLEQLQGTLQETSILYQASRALIEVTEPTQIIQVIVDYLIEPHINQVFILMLNTHSWGTPGAAVDIITSWQSSGSVDLKGVSLTSDQFPAWNLLANETVMTINDIYDPQYKLDMMEQLSIESLDTRSLALIPLRVANRSIGTIWISSREIGTFNDQTLRVYQAFAEQTSLSLEASRLLDQTNRRASQLATSAQISQRVGQLLDLDILLPQVVDLIKDRFEYDHVQVFLMDEENDWALLRASTGTPGAQMLANRHKLRKGSDSVIGRVTSTQQPTLALDTADANVVHKPNPYLPMTRSEMAIPLLVKDEVVGALDVQSNQPNAFTEEDIQVLTTLAAQIAVAIDNARLYKEAQSRASEMSFLFNTITSAAAADTLEGSLQSISQQLVSALDALSVVLYLPKTYEDYDGNSYTLMRPAAVAGIDQPIEELATVGVNDLDNLIGVVSTTQETIIIRDVTYEKRYLPAVASAQSAILTPIKSAQKLVGLVIMESARIGAYDQDTLTLMLTLAQSLAAIIQNSVLVEQLQKSNEQLREVDRLKSQFLASMSHELRTPLNSIIGFSRVMLKGIDGPLTDMQEQDLNTIYSSGNHLLNLINDILDQAKIEANELNLKFGYFDVKPMVEGVKSIAIGLMKDKPLVLNVEISPGLPQAYGDEFRSRQILLNLVSNAVKFTPQGTVGIRAYAVQDEQGIAHIRLDVLDTGIGIDQKDMPILFEPFRQVDSSLTRTVGGTGLGLPISKSLSELQGGLLMVESEVGVGSVFSVLIPTQPGAENELKQKREAQKQASQEKAEIIGSDTGVFKKSQLETTHPPKQPSPMMTQQMVPVLPTKREVLLIEDNKEMVDQYRRLLQREGYDVQVADHPSYARAMVSTMRPNIVLMDVNFSGEQGWIILKDLKEDDATFDIPIVIATLSSDSEQAYRLGAHTFLQRPVMPDMLVATIKKAEEESRRERILIIDDQPEAIRLLKQLLGEHGNYRVFSAESGIEGIGMVARRRPDLVILDLRMPEMDGFAVLNELRSNPETANIPVMIVTGEVDFNTNEQAMLQNVHILYKTGISQEEYDQFIEQVKTHLNQTNGK
jgi:GAF domain-containing protein/CheY-like chemotaxis protein